MSQVDVDMLMAAIAAMANRMGASLLYAGMADDHAATTRHLNASARQRRAMSRLMDALARAVGEEHSVWRLNHALMTIADHQREERRAAAKKAAAVPAPEPVTVVERRKGWELAVYRGDTYLGGARRACVAGSRGQSWYWPVQVGSTHATADDKASARAELIRLATKGA